VLTLEIESVTELALTKTVTTHPIKNYIEHVDLLLVQRGEKVSVEVPVLLTGDAEPGTLVTQDLTTLEVSVEALHIPEQVEVSIEGAKAGTQINAKDITLPTGAELVTDPDALVIAINVAPTASDVEGAEAEAVAEPTAESTED
jgi:large subunit ribosomal protein L25